MSVDKSHLFNQLLWNDINLLGLTSKRDLHLIDDAKKLNGSIVKVFWQMQLIRIILNIRMNATLTHTMIDVGYMDANIKFCNATYVFTILIIIID